MKTYDNEMDGQVEFYKKNLQYINTELVMEDLLKGDTDGVLNGNLIEFKLNIIDLNKTLFQAVKYLSKFRINGQNIPANIVLISLNSEIAYVYKSIDYLENIEKVYFGGASKNNDGFISNKPFKQLNYGDSDIDLIELRGILKEANYTSINIDENCIVGWAERYYKEVKNASKINFLGDSSGDIKVFGEIRKPEHFKGLINPYGEASNIKFDLICDRLNDNFKKKDLGAFYTHPLYAEKSHELVYDAIRRHQKSGNMDYVIFDFCAGTGNLEEKLNENVPDDIIDKDILSHCVLSTYEYVEWHILINRLGSKVRAIIPAMEREDTFVNGMVRGNDALSEQFYNNELIQKFVEDKDTTIIMFENPPYAETSSIEHQKKGEGKDSSGWKNNKAVIDAKKDLKGAESNDMANVFIWRAFNYYLRRDEDSLIVFSPLKYWKNAQWLNKKFLNGFALNRRHFHTKSDTVVSCILWSNENEELKEFKLKALDIEPYEGDLENKKLIDLNKEVLVKRVYTTFSQTYYDKRSFDDDIESNKEDFLTAKSSGVWCKTNGEELLKISPKVSVKSISNDNIIAYLISQGNAFANPALSTVLNRCTTYNGHGFYLRADNFIEKLPMFASGWWSTYNNDWTLDGVIYRTGDGKETYEKDLKSGVLNEWLSKVAFYTALEYYNRIRSFKGSNGVDYQNELCFDKIIKYNNDGSILSERDTLLVKKLKELNFIPNKDEIEMLSLWSTISNEIKLTENYNKEFNYGPYQIQQELNTFKKVKKGNSYVNVYDYPSLNGNLKSLRTLIKAYYNKYIVENLFKYEFLK